MIPHPIDLTIDGSQLYITDTTRHSVLATNYLQRFGSITQCGNVTSNVGQITSVSVYDAFSANGELN